MRDDTPRIGKIGDALSQLGNVAFLPRHRETTANESISGRAHRMGWRVEWWIDLPFRLFGQRDHCRKAYYKDLERAAAFKAQHRDRIGLDH
ncbi:hypothetical protein [Roseinatronobacter sp.]|uniref:hypothetical protein n=1 Tax=Roseinatronobacter sp. TaxID=1945755 RepID=UPI003F727419